MIEIPFERIKGDIKKQTIMPPCKRKKLQGDRARKIHQCLSREVLTVLRHP